MKAMLVTLAVLFGLLANPAQAAEDTTRVVVFGDSITFGVGADAPRRNSWPALVGAKRVARSGGCLVTADCFGRAPAIDTYDRRVLSKRPDVVVLAYGINDLLAGGTSREIIAGMRQVIRENRALGIRTYVATVTPVRLAIDFDRVLLGPNGNLPRRYDSGDGIHPNALGYRAMAREYARVIH